MFLRRHRKHAGGETYEYWSLVKTVRTARGPRHQLVARLGKLDGTEIAAARGWQDAHRPRHWSGVPPGQPRPRPFRAGARWM